MRRVPETVVFLCVPLVALLTYAKVETVTLVFWGALFTDYPEFLASGPERRVIWESPPGPVRDLLWAGVPGLLIGALALLLAGLVLVSVRDRTRWPFVRRWAFRVAVLAALATVAGATTGILELSAGSWEGLDSPSKRYLLIAPAFAALRLGSLVSALALGVSAIAARISPVREETT